MSSQQNNQIQNYIIVIMYHIIIFIRVDLCHYVHL